MAAGVPPSGVVTFLFTDVEGSTRRWEADADAMRKALVAHDQVLRAAIEEHDGFLFSHTGDGVVAAFSSPRSAVDAAIAAQLALALPVRMGIATGEAEVRDGDYFGTVLNRAARVMAAGHGGQILVADSTAGLLSGVDLLDLGPRRLRDVPIPLGVFQVLAEGLGTEFPPLRALEKTPGNLRPATTSLIGRDRDIAEIKTAVRSHRLVTLTGVGGVGKTRLALEIAAQLADEFPDGVWFLELAAVTDPASIPDAVATALGITQQPGKSMADSVAAALEGRLRLLVLDNCEHVRDAAADLIEAILAQSETVRLVATSREVLGIGVEQVRLVRSLDSATGTDAAAVRLFVERAQGITSEFSMTDEDEAAAVTEVCQRLDGIPLAIELAASRMSSMTAGEMRDRLDDRFRLLVGSRRGLERHQTLRHAVAWSYELLDETEKSLLNRCSVFAGGFDLESACAVAGYGDGDEYRVLDSLDALVRKSLLVAKRSSGRTRFSMLETIRQFAEEQLAASGAADDVRAVHAHHFAGKEADILGLWDGPRQREAYDWFAAELANLRTAFRWAADRGDLDVAATIATFTSMLGFGVLTYEPIAWAEELIETASAVDHPRLAALYVMAAQCWQTGRLEEAVRYSGAGQPVVSDSRADVPFGIEGWLGAPYLAVGQPERSVEWARSQLARGRDTHTLTRGALAQALMIAGCPDEAASVASGLIEAAEATRNPYVLAYAHLAYGFTFHNADPDRARDVLRRGLRIAQDSGNWLDEIFLEQVLARLEAEHGDALAALEYLVLVIRNHHDSGNTIQVWDALAVLAGLFDRFERHEVAATIGGIAFNPLIVAWHPETATGITHLRGVLGDETYESLAQTGRTMTIAEMVAYAYDQIDQARAELSAAAK